ncbi:MAG: sulfurtransferase TusA family protein [Alphaproteobacteria bacterium CG_4_10_14_0_2_um_filter_63_37]|nr:MAG: sulfurtransferase TusA family protein [Alphaproteobacteria bacterium CG_4_10_14_0_2_um_filter_63_37]
MLKSAASAAFDARIPSVQQPNDHIVPDDTIDITREICPMTFVRTKLKIERMGQGQVLEVRLKGKEPLENVPRSLTDEGHTVLINEEVAEGEGVHRLLVRVKG